MSEAVEATLVPAGNMLKNLGITKQSGGRLISNGYPSPQLSITRETLRWCAFVAAVHLRTVRRTLANWRLREGVYGSRCRPENESARFPAASTSSGMVNHYQ
jgi:hypothetical protein